MPVFQHRIADVISQQLSACTARFRDDVVAWSWASSTPLRFDSDAAAASSTETSSLTPPRAFMAFLPLAELVNSVLSLFNFLRY